jgi:putative Ca2+/H+ antiporter (TMEM165/GDT1 family)
MGMLAADGLAVFFGEKITEIVPMKVLRIVSALLFAAFGLAIALG